MTATHELATKLGGDVFDHIADERTLIKQKLIDVIHDGLLLDAAKKDGNPAAPNVHPLFTQVLNETAALVRLTLNDTALIAGTPIPVLKAIDRIHQALKATGWRP